MKKTTIRPTPNRSERTTIALVTCGFIVVSGALHLIMGGIIRPLNLRAAPQPSITQILIGRLETPRPTPPPTPRPSPTPKPKRVKVMPLPAQRTAAPARVATQPHRLVAAPKSLATPDAGAGPDVQPSTPPGPAGPLNAPSPNDYRYVVVSARFIQRVDPIYPQETVDGGDEGTVIVLLTIGPDGVSDVRVWESSGYPALDRAALQAAKESTYSVPEVNGEPVTETYRIIYAFALNS